MSAPLGPIAATCLGDRGSSTVSPLLRTEPAIMSGIRRVCTRAPHALYRAPAPEAVVAVGTMVTTPRAFLTAVQLFKLSH